MSRLIEAFGENIDGFGASYDRQTDRWTLYTMPGSKPFGTIEDRKRMEWVISALRAAKDAQLEAMQAEIEAAYREGWADGYNGGRSDGSVWDDSDPEADWEKSKARASLGQGE